MSVETPAILFESDLLRATLRPAGGVARPLVVTFDSLNFDLRLDRTGFGEPWLESMGYDAVHVVAGRNAWYQHPELPELLAAVNALGSGYPRVVTYGSSMGGYAAIRFAGRAGAATAIAVSPQFSVAPARVPFDDRWLEHGGQIDFLWDAPVADDQALRDAWVFYDPADLDRLHVEALAAEYPVRRLPLRHAGHPAGAYLAEGGLLAPAVNAMIDGTFDAETFQRGVRDARRLSGQYYFTLAQRQPPHRPRTALALAAEAARLAPASAPYLSLQAQHLEGAGRLDEAERLHRRALELLPEHPKYHLDLAGLLARMGRFEEARALALNIRGLGVDTVRAHQRACEILFRAGDYAEALAEARTAQARAPSNMLKVWSVLLAALLRWPVIGVPILDLVRRAFARPASPLRAWITRSLRRPTRARA